MNTFNTISEMNKFLTKETANEVNLNIIMDYSKSILVDVNATTWLLVRDDIGIYHLANIDYLSFKVLANSHDVIQD